MKICYFFNSINYEDGIERLTIVKANYWAEKGHETYIVVTDHNVNIQLIEPLNDGVKLINLDINYYKDEHKFFLSKKKTLLHFKKIQRFVKTIKPDIIISVGQSEKYLLSLIKTSAIKIREIHFLSTYRTLTYKKNKIAKLLNYIDYNLFIKGYDQYVLLTNEDYNDYYIGDKLKTTVISNPITITPLKTRLNTKNIICVCRLSNLQKNVNELIDAFAVVSKKHPDWVLKIYGEGQDKNLLLEQIKNLDLKNVFIEGYTNNIPKALENADIFVSTSNFEGCPLAILEAMACGLPIVSYQFPVGAKDILLGHNAGFLVPMHNFEILAKKICTLIENPYLLEEMSYNALKRAEDFSKDSIMTQWMNLFLKLLDKKTY